MSIKVLVVEDDREIRGLLRTALAAEGFEVLTAVSVSEATALLEHDPPDLVVLDLGLPDGDGAEILRRIRHAPEGRLPHPGTPVLIMTARDQVASRIEGLDLGPCPAQPSSSSRATANARATSPTALSVSSITYLAILATVLYNETRDQI